MIIIDEVGGSTPTLSAEALVLISEVSDRGNPELVVFNIRHYWISLTPTLNLRIFPHPNAHSNQSFR